MQIYRNSDRNVDEGANIKVISFKNALLLSLWNVTIFDSASGGVQADLQNHHLIKNEEGSSNYRSFECVWESHEKECERERHCRKKDTVGDGLL